MSKRIKFAGPSKRMREALEAEGLSVDWDEKINDIHDLIFEGTYYTGIDWEKCVVIDLRDEFDLSTTERVDAAISNQLDEAYDDFSVTDEFLMYMQGTEEERRKRGVPNSDRLLEDMHEQDSCLKRFAEVADAVVCGKQIPPKEQSNCETIFITPQMAEKIRSICNIAMKYLPPTVQSEANEIAMALTRKLGE